MVPTSLAGLPEHIPRHPPPVIPTPSAAANSGGPQVLQDPQEESQPNAAPPVMRYFVDTVANRFRIFRRYFRTPVQDPEEGRTLDTFADAPTHVRASDHHEPLQSFGVSNTGSVQTLSFAPFLNATVFRLMRWFYSSSFTKSIAGLNSLVHEVLLADNFSREDLHSFSAAREMKRMDDHQATSEAGTFSASNKWREGSVKIGVPKPKNFLVHGDSEANAPQMVVDGIWYRTLCDIIQMGAQAASARSAHWIPFELYWQPPRSPERVSPQDADSSIGPDTPSLPSTRIYSEVYNSQALLDADAELQSQPRHPADSDSDVEYAVAPLMLYSDSTHLTNFGTTSLWPLYVWFGWLSKYERGKPSAFAAHHLAYIPLLPKTIQKWYQDQFGEPATESILRFCKRELMQKIWELLLDDEFLLAYKEGILIVCADGITRRLFPRIFTYSADYPEKCLIACVKPMGKCPCTDCHVRKTDIHLMGTKQDLRWIENVRGWVFEQGIDPESKHMNDSPLNEHSTTPARNAFSTRLAAFGFDVYRILVPDLMHKFELGVWKSTLTHLLRLVIALGGDNIQTLDSRFSQVPTFGRSTIRPFGSNMSGLKKLAARDYEDILQCSFPCFEGLGFVSPSHNKIVLDMIFRLSTWHALAKLRLHSEDSLRYMEHVTTLLGATMRSFVRHVCLAYLTKELPKETAARQRRKVATTASIKVFDLNTIKFHKMPEYPRSIRQFGTTDNTTTQPGEQEHHHVKEFYDQTNKTLSFVGQIARRQGHQVLLHEISSHADVPQPPLRKKRKLNPEELSADLRIPGDTKESLSSTSPKDHHHVSFEQREHVNIKTFVHKNKDDIACTPSSRPLGLCGLDIPRVTLVCVCFAPSAGNASAPLHRGHPTSISTHPPLPLLRLVFAARSCVNLYNRVHGHDASTLSDVASVHIRKDQMWLHKTLRVNYTTYDMRREQDSVNPSSHADVMMLAARPDETTDTEGDHPYLYARVLSVFHVNVTLRSEPLIEPRPIHVLWVRWFELDTFTPGGFNTLRPHRLRFAPVSDAFDFISPDRILRSVHLIPAFHHGRSDVALRGPSIARIETDDIAVEDDWNYHYVGMWSDRDLFMRYFGGAVGHLHISAEAHVTPAIEDSGDASELVHPSNVENAAGGSTSNATSEDELEQEESEDDREEALKDVGELNGEDGDDDEHALDGYAAL
ncbi:uncharacterized protein BXZ73DRAFT_103768 [Epithele typhae]|uniref:uncharacterized protein n=1 Tax=Epithele typhae TaxID=378194 RepID=UPI002008526F|nr:uncharacterized protein BXZ73DRAFT_103768 [Epithele typhae]KAH9923724.1 hypothetical protein BXZ73DRAFT_103768 [Epithele typhae]